MREVVLSDVPVTRREATQHPPAEPKRSSRPCGNRSEPGDSMGRAVRGLADGPTGSLGSAGEGSNSPVLLKLRESRSRVVEP